MKKVLYISNIRVPYRVTFFNQLAEQCDLTVLYECSKAGARNKKWVGSIKENYKAIFLDGINVGNESSFSLNILKYLCGDYDVIVLGCYNTPLQMFANLFLRMIRKPFIVNFDGEIFVENNGFKSRMKKFFINGGTRYVVAGEKSAESVRKILKYKKKVIPYYFSSLTTAEIYNNAKTVWGGAREKYVLVVGQYFPYKGMDIAAEVARALPDINFKFVGTGERTELFISENHLRELPNVNVIPFLQKEELAEEYRKCRLLVLPSRRECWGLVINEAASFGTPIVSTLESGAGVEFLFDEYPFLLVAPCDVQSLKNTIKAAVNMEGIEEYSQYLIKKSKDYSIERSVMCHLKAFN